jgi:hypothetical protein
MSATDVLKQALVYIEAGDIDKVASMTTDDLVFEGGMPEAVGKNEFIGMMKALVSAIPDWKFNAQNFQENGNIVRVIFQVTGTQTRTLSLPMLPQPVAPTGKHFQIPREPTEFIFTGNKVSRIHVDPVPGGGVMGILEQLGVRILTH